jgi:hypothetical protein
MFTNLAAAQRSAVSLVAALLVSGVCLVAALPIVPIA